ncbi:hypothetical protein BJL96_27740 [Burkholderia cenocepacia]|nr:hypothetical protein [Burkholderia cenocepacia]
MNMQPNEPSIDDLKSLDGKIFAMLNESEREILAFYRNRGRKFGVAVAIINEADPELLSLAKSQEQADAIMATANSRVKVTVA